MKGKIIIPLILSLSIVGGLLTGCGNNDAAGKIWLPYRANSIR